MNPPFYVSSQVAFRETILEPCNYDYWHRKQSGGRGEYARVIGRMEPLPASNNTIVEFKVGFPYLQLFARFFCQVGDIDIDPGCDLPRRPNGFTGLSDYSYPSDPIR